MVRAQFENSKPSLQFVFVLMIVLASWLVFQLIALFSGMLIFNIGFTEVPNVLGSDTNPLTVPFQKYIQSLVALGMFFIAPVISVIFITQSPARYLKIDHFPGFLMVLLVSVLMIVSLPMNNFFTFLNGELNVENFLPGLQEYMENLELKSERLFERFLSVHGIGPLLLNLLIVAVIPAIGEELLFRGILQKIFIQWTGKVFLGVAITSLAFALLHFQFLSVLPRFVLGMILGYVFVWSGSLWMPIIAHFVNNAFAVTYYYFMYNNQIESTIEKIGMPGQNVTFALLSIISVAAILWGIYSMRRKKKSDSL